MKKGWSGEINYDPKFTLSFRWGICAMFEHDGPLFDTKISQVLTVKLKWAAHAFFKLFRLKSSNCKSTNSLGCTGRCVCFESGSDARLWTMIHSEQILSSFGHQTLHQQLWPFYYSSPLEGGPTYLAFASLMFLKDRLRCFWMLEKKSPRRALFAREA